TGGYLSGSSAAAATVSGVAALLFAADPRASAAEVRRAVIVGANRGIVALHGEGEGDGPLSTPPGPPAPPPPHPPPPPRPSRARTPRAPPPPPSPALLSASGCEARPASISNGASRATPSSRATSSRSTDARRRSRPDREPQSCHCVRAPIAGRSTRTTSRGTA